MHSESSENLARRRSARTASNSYVALTGFNVKMIRHSGLTEMKCAQCFKACLGGAAPPYNKECMNVWLQQEVIKMPI